MIAAVSLMAAPIPNGEAELNAENNFLWPEAVEITKTHQAHLMVVVLGQEEDLLERGKLYVKLLASCCRQKNAWVSIPAAWYSSPGSMRALPT